MNGVRITDLKQIAVQGGDVYHAMTSSDPDFVGFGEAYFSFIKPGTIKGWKKHLRMTLNLVVPVGRIKFVIYDDRPESLTSGKFYEIRLSPDNYKRLTIEPGLWVAFKGEATIESLLLDIIPQPHDPNEVVRKGLCEIKYDF